MVWLNEEVIGVDAAAAALKRILPGLKPFQCVLIQPRQVVKLMIFQKPWIGILISGHLTSAEITGLHVVGKRLGLVESGSVPSHDGSKGFSFCSLTEDFDFAENCRHFLEIFFDESSAILIHGVTATVNTVAP